MGVHAHCEFIQVIQIISMLTVLSIHDNNRDLLNSSSPRPMSPVKYPTLTDETDKKNFSPVKWRVIGGGVRMGVMKNDENDHSLVDSPSSVQKPSVLPPLKISVRRRSSSIPPTPSDVLINVEHVSFLVAQAFLG